MFLDCPCLGRFCDADKVTAYVYRSLIKFIDVFLNVLKKYGTPCGALSVNVGHCWLLVGRRT